MDMMYQMMRKNISCSKFVANENKSSHPYFNLSHKFLCNYKTSKSRGGQSIAGQIRATEAFYWLAGKIINNLG